MTRARCLLLVLLLLAARSARAAPPVVAVDTIESPGVELSPTATRSLSIFLGARLAAIPEMRVIPPEQTRAALAKLRREQVEVCPAGQTCALELGHQLAANMVISPRIIRAGEGCVVTLTLLDVRTATAEHAVTANGSCDEGGLAAAISAALTDLASKLRSPAASRPPVDAAEPEPERVSVYVTSKPPGMPLELDGEAGETTPARLDLVRNKRYRITIAPKWPYETVTKTIVAERWQEIAVELHYQPIDPMELATTTEWFSFGFGGGMLRGGERGLLGVTLRVATLRWRHLFWTVGEILGGVAVGGSGSHSIVSFGSRAGWPLYLGHSGRHQLLAGLGLGYMTVDLDKHSGRAFGLSPGVEYVYLATNGAFQAGVGLHALLPAAISPGDLADPWPYQLLLTLRAGISISPQLRALRRGTLR